MPKIFEDDLAALDLAAKANLSAASLSYYKERRQELLSNEDDWQLIIDCLTGLIWDESERD